MPENRFSALFAEADAAFNGKYKMELNELAGLSKEEIDAVAPGTTDLKMYLILTQVVEQASKNNLSQAQLAEDIKELGELAVKIARKVPRLAALL
ncbi:hypothetical protein [uncultured Sunxiuqinia sp.]|uniref:hypothetical protein n=1 Tax=uncultured Sunxiuqinia sp. TaxID=1573825 RepID=UPI0030D855B3